MLPGKNESETILHEVAWESSLEVIRTGRPNQNPRSGIQREAGTRAIETGLSFPDVDGQRIGFQVKNPSYTPPEMTPGAAANPRPQM